MNETTNWKSTVVLYTSFATAAIAFTLAPDNWAFLVAIAIVMAGWFLSESIQGKKPTDKEAGDKKHTLDDRLSEAFSIITGSAFFGLLAALILPGLGETFRWNATPVYAIGAVMGILFGLWVYRGHSRGAMLLAIASFVAPVFLFAFRWYAG